MKIGILSSSSISGGNNVIFEHASRIHQRGDMEVILIFPKEVSDRDLAWHPMANTLPRKTYNEAKNVKFDVLIATFWKTCYDLFQFQAKSYLYFNQSVESAFYENINQKKYAESTYLLGLNVITEASWIQKHIYKNYKHQAELVLNGINKDNYAIEGNVIQPKTENQLRILIEGSYDYPFKNIPKTIELCKQSKADEIWWLTSSDIKEYVGIDKVFSKIPINKVQEIYRSCDVLVKLSTIEGMFGPPLEIFHCGGTAITYDVNGHEEYMIHQENSLIVPMHEEQKVVKFINLLKENPQELARLKQNAIKTAKNWCNWDYASKEFETAILKSTQKPQISQERLRILTKHFSEWYQYTAELEKENINYNKKLGLKIHNKLKRIKKIFKKK